MATTWSTTFYYEQELRSAYMNNLLRGMLNPGIYNMNAAIYTKDSTNPQEQGVWLHIEPGAQLVFSNGYKVVNNLLERDLNSLGNYIVKCVAEEPVDIQLAAIGDKNTAIFGSTSPSSTESVAPVIFVYAWLKYEEDAQSLSEPTFSLAAPSSNVLLASEASLSLPNEGLSPSSASADTRISYLILGVLLDNGEYEAPYTSDNDWIRTSRNGQAEWVKGHVFTGQGLPDYGKEILKSYSTDPTAFLYSQRYNRLYLTSGQFYFNSVLYDMDGTDWRSVYGQGGVPGSASPTADTGMLTDHILEGPADTTYTLSPLNLSGLAGKLVLEVLFLAVESEYSRPQPSDLTRLLTGGYDVSRKLLPYRVVCDAPDGLELDTTKLYEDYGFSVATAVVPLDVSLNNVERLKAIIANKNAILPIVDTIRQNALTASPYLDPTIGGALIPLLITFRQVNDTEDGFTDPQSFLSGDIFLDARGQPGGSACNPANILGFFDLQSSSFEVTNAGISAQEVYPTIPFVD